LSLAAVGRIFDLALLELLALRLVTLRLVKRAERCSALQLYRCFVSAPLLCTEGLRMP